MHDYKVISNSSPIIILSNIGRLELLEKVYGNVIIPQGVNEEVFGLNNVKNIEWLKVMQIPNVNLQQYLGPLLHKGEIEVIVLAKEIKAELAIIDDYLARKYAHYLGLTITGTLGVIVKAKQKGLLKNVKPVIDDMIEKGFWIDNKLYSTVLKNAGE